MEYHERDSVKKGCIYGTHRVIYPKGVLPQPAIKVDNDFSQIYDNEILCDVITLNIDSASFTEIKKRASGNPEKIAEIILNIVHEYGKHKNPWTGSGGMFIGSVVKIGEALKDRINLKPGDKIASLVSLSLTPLTIEKIVKIDLEKDQVHIKGQAILFESGVWVKIPEDIPISLSLALFDVAGAPPQVARILSKGDRVAILGANGKSGLLCCYQAKKSVGEKGEVIAVIHNENGREVVENAPFVDHVVVSDAQDAISLLKKIEEVTNNKLCDVVISCVSTENCEMGAILITRERGKVYFFSMATSFTKAALGAEGVGKDVDLIIGNGYCKNHAELTLNILRESAYINEVYRQKYCSFSTDK